MESERRKTMCQPGDRPVSPAASFLLVVRKVHATRNMLRSVLSLLSSNVSASVLTAIGGLLVARFIGPEENGHFRLFTIPLTYIIFLHLGTWDGLWRQIPLYAGMGVPQRIDEVASAAGAFNIAVSVAATVGYFLCAVHSFLQHDPQGGFGWLSQMICCWGIFYGGYLTSTYRTLDHFTTLSKIQITQTILTFAMVFTLPVAGFYGLCARAAVPSLVAIFLFHRFRPLRMPYRFNIPALTNLMRIGFPFSFWGNLYTSVWAATESALVLALGGVSALGLFSVAGVIRSAVNALPIAVTQVITPRIISGYARDGSVRNANSRNLRVTIGLTLAMVVIAHAGSLMLDILVPMLIPKYQAGIPVMKLSLWFPVIQAAFLPINALFATGNSWLYGRSVIVGIIIFIAATLLFLPTTDGALAVTAGSLLGRVARTFAAYLDLFSFSRQESGSVQIEGLSKP